MRLYLVLLFLASQLKFVAAYADAGAWERLLFYYIYQVDEQNTDRQIAQKCRGTAPNRRCNLSEFVKWINQNDNIDYSKFNNVDTTRADATAKAIYDAKATGAYDCTHIFQGPYGQNDVSGNMHRINNWVQSQGGRLAALSDTDKNNFQLASRTVAKIRKNLRVNSFVEFYKGKGFILHVTQVPIFDGSTDLVNDVDVRGTLEDQANKDKGLTLETIRSTNAEFNKADSPGHSDFVKNAANVAQGLSLVCAV